MEYSNNERLQEVGQIHSIEEVTEQTRQWEGGGDGEKGFAQGE